LFSDANDLAIVLQMLMDGGTYGGKRYLKRATVDQFHQMPLLHRQWRARSNRRGLGWDKPTAPRASSRPSLFADASYRELWPHRFYRHSDMGRSARPFHLRFP
jgi:CubicO group peptidase (beta-lactamase class C family)